MSAAVSLPKMAPGRRREEKAWDKSAFEAFDEVKGLAREVGTAFAVRESC
jgi:hypothetical protein